MSLKDATETKPVAKLQGFPGWASHPPWDQTEEEISKENLRKKK